jgi:GrpB-like predicted nucleotidyltransferase (UPF0157 family)
MKSKEKRVKMQDTTRSNTMSYEDYDEKYPHVFAEVVRLIQAALPSVHVEHVGSTAIPGLGGRRVLDLVIAAEQGRHNEIEPQLLRIGFVKSPVTHFLPMLTTSIHYQGKDYSILLYLLPDDHEIYQGWIAFRTYMQQHPEEVQHYADVKKRAIAEGKTDAGSYQQAKTPYLESLVKRMGAK